MERAFPSHVEWALTDACELRCRHCHARRRRSEQAELTRAEADALARELAARGVRQVTLSGGEPLLRAGWDEIAGRLGRDGVGVELISNGQTLDRAVARVARMAGVRRVLVSLDGLEATHDAIRGRAGAWQSVARAARALDAEGLPFGVLTTVLRANRSELVELGLLVEAWGARVWQVWLGIPQDDSELWLVPSEIPAVVRRLVALGRRLPILRLGDNLGTGCESGALRPWTTAAGAVVAPPSARQGFPLQAGAACWGSAATHHRVPGAAARPGRGNGQDAGARRTGRGGLRRLDDSARAFVGAVPSLHRGAAVRRRLSCHGARRHRPDRESVLRRDGTSPRTCARTSPRRGDGSGGLPGPGRPRHRMPDSHVLVGRSVADRGSDGGGRGSDGRDRRGRRPRASTPNAPGTPAPIRHAPSRTSADEVRPKRRATPDGTEEAGGRT